MFEPMELPDGVSELDIETDEILPIPEEERESESDIKEMTMPANVSANSSDGVAKNPTLMLKSQQRRNRMLQSRKQ